MEKYLENIVKHVDKYADTNYPYNMFNDNYDLVVKYEIYIQRFNEDIEEQSKKVLSFQDGDGIPTYFLKGIKPDFFLAPYKILVKAFVFRIEPIEELRDILTFKILKTDDCVICLNNKPGIMFYDCRHCCVCSDCEKVKPLMRCPYCRNTITTKIII